MVAIYGKEGCERCTKAKEHTAALGFTYDYHDMEYHTTLHDGWKHDGSVEILAYTQVDDSLPVMNIKGELYPYSQGMKLLKSIKKAGW